MKADFAATKKEIGGILEFPCLDCDTYDASIHHYLMNLNDQCRPYFLRDGRQAIKSILLNINNIRKKICYIPAFSCYSVIQPFLELGLNIIFYDILPPLIPDIDKKIQNSVIFLIDYFGTDCLSDDQIDRLLKNNNTIILDVTHSVLNKKRFSISNKELYYVASLRKIFPIPDGGFVQSQNRDFIVNARSPENFIQILDVMIQKKFYLNNVFSEDPKTLDSRKNLFYSSYLDYEENKNENFVGCESIPLISQHILANVKIKPIVDRRIKNKEIIYETLRNKEFFLIDQQDFKSPFFVPLIFDNFGSRERMKKRLIKNNIYPPVHWQIPIKVPTCFTNAHSLSKRILSIPIDQRYNRKDMIKISNVINERKKSLTVKLPKRQKC